MRKGMVDFFEAIGFERGDDMVMMLRQLGVGIIIGLALITVLGIGELLNQAL